MAAAQGPGPEKAIIVAHENTRRSFVERNLTAYAEKAAKDRAYAGLPATAPQLTFQDRLILDDGNGRRAELYCFGNAHTTGDVFTYLPKQKIVFTGDACVNGDYNYLGDADTASWIEVLGKAQALGAEIVVPGHGAVGKPDVLASQKGYFGSYAIPPLIHDPDLLAHRPAAVRRREGRGAGGGLKRVDERGYSGHR